MNKEIIKKYKAEFDHWLNGGTLLARRWVIDGNDGDTSYTLWYKVDSEHWEAEKIFNTSLEYDKTQIVINDEYVEFRKALAEGKTIQYKNKHNSFPILVENKKDYRIISELLYCHNIDYPYTITKDIGGVHIQHVESTENLPTNTIKAEESKGKFTIKEEWINIPEGTNFITEVEYRIKPDEPKFKVGDWVKLTVLGKTVHRIESLIYNYNLCCYHPSLSNFNGNIDCTESLELWEPQPGEHIWDNTYGLAVVEKVSLEEGVLCRECFNSKALFTPTMKEVEPFIGTLPSFLTN